MAHYKHAKTSASSVIVKVLIVLLIMAVVAGGGFAVYHFVFDKEPEPAATETPTVLLTEATLQQAPTQAPTEDPQVRFDSLAADYMSGMSQKEKICQMLIVSPEVLTGVENVTEAGDMTKQAIADYPVGGIVYFADNLESAKQTKELIQNTQSYSKTPMFIAVDEEGGDVARVAEKLGTTKLEPMYSYREDGEVVAFNNAATIANDIKQFGFNLDFAPVADVFSDATNTVIGERAYSSDSTQAGSLISKAVEGFHSAQMICTLKHFPGMGESSADTHTAEATISKNSEELMKCEMVPFIHGIKAGADMVMVGHAKATSIDADNPSSLSNKVITGMLRKQLEFNGVIITDSLQMAGVTNNFTSAEIAVKAINAGVDILLLPQDIDEYIDAIESAVNNGEIKQSQIDESVKRILSLKFKYGIIPEATAQPTAAATETVMPTAAP